MTLLPPPSAYSFTRFFKNAKHSGTGRIGIPYCAYEQIDDRASHIFEKVLFWIADGNNMHPDSNDTLNMFIPKPSDTTDEIDPGIVLPEKTRPLGLKNTDNKSIAGHKLQHT